MFRLPKTAVATVLLITGLVCLALWRVVGGTERQAFAPGAQAPQYVAVTSGNTYSLAVPGGMPALLAAGVGQAGAGDAGGSAPDLECQWNSPGYPPQVLKTTAEGVDTKATDVVGSFVAPVTGRLHIDCQHWGSMFVPDADGAAGDPSGWLLLASSVLLLLGGSAAVSAGWSGWARRFAGRAADGDTEPRSEVGDLTVEDADASPR